MDLLFKIQTNSSFLLKKTKIKLEQLCQEYNLIPVSIAFKTKKQKFCVLKAPCIHKKTREIYCLFTYRLHFYIKNITLSIIKTFLTKIQPLALPICKIQIKKSLNPTLLNVISKKV